MPAQNTWMPPATGNRASNPRTVLQRATDQDRCGRKCEAQLLSQNAPPFVCADRLWPTRQFILQLSKFYIQRLGTCNCNSRGPCSPAACRAAVSEDSFREAHTTPSHSSLRATNVSHKNSVRGVLSLNSVFFVFSLLIVSSLISFASTNNQKCLSLSLCQSLCPPSIYVRMSLQ